MDELEFMTYREAEISGSDLILKHCVRGKDYTHIKTHDADDFILHVGSPNDYFRYQPPPNYRGKKIYIKCIPGNAEGDIPLGLADVTGYEYTIQGYGAKATHTAMLEIEQGGIGLGNIVRTTDSDVKVIWEKTNRLSGMKAQTLGEWEWHGFVEGDVDDYDIIIFQSDGVTIQASHLGIGLVTSYTYTNTQNSTDFGGSPSDHFWIGVRPVIRGVGYVPDMEKQEVIRI
jgi:hypothetical protein